MSIHDPIDPSGFKDSWSVSVTDDLERSARRAWMVAIAAAIIAVLEAVALVLLMPLKTVEPYTLLVDRQTGYVEALAPLDKQTIAPDAALTRSFLVQYVIARESFDRDSVQSDYRKVALWSAGEARERYLRNMQSDNPESPLSSLPRQAVVEVQIRSISEVTADRSLVRFTTRRADASGRSMPPQYWASIVRYGFSGAEMKAEDRMINPLGFQVTSYRRDAETLPELTPRVIPTARPTAEEGSEP